MILEELLDNLDELCPAEFAMDWDNSGLQTGRPDRPVRRVLIALDATSEVVDMAVREKADLILTHHPLIFKGIKRVTEDDFVGRRILTMAENRIACFAMHTNFDVLCMADAAADLLELNDRQVLEMTRQEWDQTEGIGRTGFLKKPMTLSELTEYVKTRFSLPSLRCYGDPDLQVRKVSILPGSGGGEIGLALEQGAEVMITGDISHHTGIDALEQGIAVIDAGHYGLEKLFIPYMRKYLKKEFPELELAAAPVRAPFFVK